MPIKDIRKESVLNNKELDNDDISRYSRQLILPEIGVQGQIRLKNSKILIVGAGGLGCPAAIYLSAAGVGILGIVDYDEVEISNLHRQILHAESRVGLPKSQSAFITCHGLNSKVDFVPYHLALDSSNALQIISKYDIVLDATDNVATRYLLNDACVLADKPLVSGSALRFEGQLTVYNHDKGPCYRCLYPKPPPPETVTNCSDGGVLGVVPGIIGCLQALEAIKIAAGISTSFSERMLLFDGIDGLFRNIRLRGRQVNCPICGDNPTITKLIDYEEFCGAKATDKDKDISLLQENQRLSSKEYKRLLVNKTPHILIDVRQPVELDICQLPNPNTINIPVSHLKKEEKMKEVKTSIDQLNSNCDITVPIIVVCRRGNDSQAAVNELKNILSDKDNITIQDIRGGLHAWAKQVDPNFPVY
ncbi:hypothetical protein LOTGIDRAFT_133196 [Lottia gigantea]|uniref:Adenylyltransferase and sulfurtransferase MOCS3 homolog n=1 Tax=Lottia gigantea TaxID=225164 RepID=V3ZM40_LOTGI|nr:hypothetical protein LOTGIDRAFT_133196 [Lottia gigantea]ESO83505.1 hypothetical protein LOTGIDRAFT_133196 [Lottia gigantea]